MSTPESKLQTDIAKVKVFWLDYRAYLVCAAFLGLRIYLGAHFHL